MLLEALPPEAIALDEEVLTWEEAVRRAGTLLVRSGAVAERYVDAMVRTVREMGPYVVIAPGLALPHARPEDGVLRIGFSLLRLRRPVVFGHPEHDPVDLVFALAAVDSESHLQALRELSELLSTPQRVNALRGAKSEEAIRSLIRRTLPPP